jgi:RHS repeat-associated protein
MPFGPILSNFESQHTKSNALGQTSATGMAYYGFRYSPPSMGRFINRDPLKEDGGLNIYAMTANNPIGRWDYLGLDYTDSDGVVHMDPMTVTASNDSDDDDETIYMPPTVDLSNLDIPSSPNEDMSLMLPQYPSGMGLGNSSIPAIFDPDNTTPIGQLTGCDISLTDGFTSMSNYSNASDPFLNLELPGALQPRAWSMTNPYSDLNSRALEMAMAKLQSISPSLNNFLNGGPKIYSGPPGGTFKSNGSGTNWNTVLNPLEFTLASIINTLYSTDKSSNSPILGFNQATLAWPFTANPGNVWSAKLSSNSSVTTISNAFNGGQGNSFSALVSIKIEDNLTFTVGFGSSTSATASFLPQSPLTSVPSYTSMISTPRGVKTPSQGEYGFASVSWSFNQFNLAPFWDLFR